MARRPSSLKGILTIQTLIVTVMMVVISVALIFIAMQLAHASRELESAVERLHLTQDAEIDLLLHGRAADPLLRNAIASELLAELSAVESHATTVHEAQMVLEARDQLQRYLRAERAASPGRALALHERAHAALDALARFNVVHAREVLARSARWSGIAHAFGLCSAAVASIVAGGFLWWLSARAFRPVFALSQAMDRFGRGELDSRAEESGPGELREMTRQFNVMADTLVAQRGHQMSTLAGVAHDVLTPLTSIKLSMGRLPAGQPLPPEARLRRIIDNVQRQAERIERMMRDLVDTAGIDNGGLELQLETCDGREVIREACDLIGLDQAEGRLEMHLPAAPVSLYCDRHRMERVLANLVGNALKYSPHASPVRVAIAVRDHEVVISIADQGIGISAEDREKLFRPFRRLEPGRQRSRGTGLGLFVARSIVEAHAGRIDIDSTPGEGSTFRIHLPPGRNGPA